MTENENSNNHQNGIYGEQQIYDFTTDSEFYKNIFSANILKKNFQITKMQKIFLFCFSSLLILALSLSFCLKSLNQGIDSTKQVATENLQEKNKFYYARLLDKNGNILTTEEYSNILPLDDVFLVQKGKSNFGIINKNGKAIIPCKYMQIEKLSDGKYLAEDKNGFKDYVFDKNGNEIYCGKRLFNSSDYFIEYDYKNKLYTVWDKNFRKLFSSNLIPSYFDNELFILKDFQKGKKLVNAKGVDVLADFYYSINLLTKTQNRKYFKVSKHNQGMFGIIDENEKIIVPEMFDKIFFVEKTNEFWGIKYNNEVFYRNSANRTKTYVSFDLNGQQKFEKTVKNSEYIEFAQPDFKVIPVKNSVPFVKIRYKNIISDNHKTKVDYELVDKNNNVISEKYEDLKPLDNKYYLSFNKGPSVIDGYGNFVIPPNLFILISKDKCYFLATNPFKNKNFKKLIFTIFDDNFKTLTKISSEDTPIVGKKDFIIISNDNKYYAVNEKGKNVLKNKYDVLKIVPDDEMLYIAKKDSHFGVISSDEKIIIPFEYQEIKPDNNIFKVKKDNKWRILDYSNNPIINIFSDKELIITQNNYIIFNKI